MSAARRSLAPTAPPGPRFVCIHGHFYQPPRESPWLEAIETQPSAKPFHDWNERVSAECYRPNAFARILDTRGRIERVVNNYQRISWNFGPTLLSWMETADPELYAALQAADRERVARTGFGAGMAQVYGHAILPLCNPRDRATQVRWGVADFRHRFGRAPKGMWLAETACDTPSLEALVDAGIELTVLAPNQALKARPRGGRWHDVRGGRIDPRRPYLVHLPSGRSIHVFFYDGPVSRAVAFERLLEDGHRFRDRLVSTFDNSPEPQLAQIATDGETYGHHHRFGEMALAYALDLLGKDPRYVLTTYEELLAHQPAAWEAAIIEGTSWSCAHGIERWRSDCGCSTGGGPGWNQAWRAPLREALDWLRDEVNASWEPAAAAVLKDPWGARDRYVEVLLGGDPAREAFLSRELMDGAGEPGRERALQLLEAQRNLLLMYTSCGWFFNDLSGIETVQILRYAARASEIATALFGDRFEQPFVDRLARARSNRPEAGDGAAIWKAEVVPSRVDLGRAAVHVAARTLFEPSGDRDPMPAFTATVLSRQDERSGRARLSTGSGEVRVRATGARRSFEFAAVHLGDHNLGGGVRAPDGPERQAALRTELTEAFRRFDLPEVLRALERHFPGATFSLRALVFDEQARVLTELLRETRADIDHAYATLYEEHAPLVRYLGSLGQAPPAAMLHAASHALSARLVGELRRPGDLDLPTIEGTLAEAKQGSVALDAMLVAPEVTRRLITLLTAPTLPNLAAAAVLAAILKESAPEAHLLARAEEAVVRARDTGLADDARPLLARIGELMRVAT